MGSLCWTSLSLSLLWCANLNLESKLRGFYLRRNHATLWICDASVDIGSVQTNTCCSNTWLTSRDEGKNFGPSLAKRNSSDTSMVVGRWSYRSISWLGSVCSRGLNSGTVIGWFWSESLRRPWPCSVHCIHCLRKSGSSNLFLVALSADGSVPTNSPIITSSHSCEDREGERERNMW